MAWQHYAECRKHDPDLFFPTPREGSRLAKKQFDEAREICMRCPVRHPCLMMALNQGWTEGMFGGMTPSERRPLSKMRDQPPDDMDAMSGLKKSSPVGTKSR